MGEFMRMVESCGIAALGLHMRKRDERPRDPAHWKDILQLCDAVKIPVIANGDFFSRKQIDEFWKLCEASKFGDNNDEASDSLTCTPVYRVPSSIMIARGALWNPSIFSKDEPKPLEHVASNYLEAALRGNATYQNTKWVLNEMLTAGSTLPLPSEIFGSKLKDFRHR